MIRTILLAVLALFTAACTVTLPRSAIVLDDRTVAARQIVLPHQPAKEATLPAGTYLVIEDLPAPFGTLHTVRTESHRPRPLIVFCGGNMFREEAQGAGAITALSAFGDVLLFDYPGYGSSGGSGTRAEFAAAEATLLPRIEAWGAGRTVVFWGHSLGGGVCSSLAAHAKVKTSALLLAATFARYDTVKDDMTGWFSALFAVEPAADLIAYDAPKLLADYRGAIVVAALRSDEVIGFKVSRKLADELRADGHKVDFIALSGKGHSKIHVHPDFRPKVKAALQAAGIAVE